MQKVCKEKNKTKEKKKTKQNKLRVRSIDIIPEYEYTEKKLEIIRFYEFRIKIVSHLVKGYFKHILIIPVASKRLTYRFKLSLQVYLFRNKVDQTPSNMFGKE